jgi:hypothetical protein
MTLERDICLTGVMTEARGSEWSDLGTGEAGDRRSHVRMDVAKEMPTTVTRTTAETAGTTRFEAMQKNGNWERRRKSEALLTPSNWRSRME